MIRVVNKRKEDSGVYIGRPSLLGNPFSHLSSKHAQIKVATREEAVDRYRGWLEEQLEDSDSLEAKAFNNLVQFYREFGELTLVCWCKPLPCHGDVLKEMIEERL